MKIITIILLLFCTTAFANNVCEPYKPNDHEPIELIIKEEAYSFENAQKALSILGHITTKPPKKLSGSENYISTANAEIILKGYLLRSNCLVTKDKNDCKAFCEHMKKRPIWFD